MVKLFGLDVFAEGLYEVIVTQLYCEKTEVWLDSYLEREHRKAGTALADIFCES